MMRLDTRTYYNYRNKLVLPHQLLICFVIKQFQESLIRANFMRDEIVNTCCLCQNSLITGYDKT